MVRGKDIGGLRAVFAARILAAVAVVAIVGCRNAPSRWRAFKPPAIAHSAATRIEPYRVGVGDVLRLVPDGTKEPILVTVDVDGYIRAKELPPFDVDGRTLPEIESLVAFVRPMRVEVETYASQVIHVSGVLEKGAPAAVPYRGPETVQELIARVGCKDCVQGYRVRVVRPGGEVSREPEIFSMEFNERGDNRNTLEPPLTLCAGDFVYVEKNLGRKGPMTLLTDQRFRARPTNWIKKIRFLQSAAP